jgi:hypothetical protein
MIPPDSNVSTGVSILEFQVPISITETGVLRLCELHSSFWRCRFVASRENSKITKACLFRAYRKFLYSLSPRTKLAEILALADEIERVAAALPPRRPSCKGKGACSHKSIESPSGDRLHFKSRLSTG